MPKKKTVERVIPAELSVTTPPVLTKIDFNQTGQRVPKGTQVPMNIGLSISRINNTTIAVQIICNIDGVEGITVRVGYGITIEIANPSENSEELVSQLRFAAGIGAPAILYPYIRQTIQELTMKAGQEQIVLPIIDARSVFNPEKLDVPSVTELEHDPE